jgi:hypothetical protein
MVGEFVLGRVGALPECLNLLQLFQPELIYVFVESQEGDLRVE